MVAAIEAQTVDFKLSRRVADKVTQLVKSFSQEQGSQIHTTEEQGGTLLSRGLSDDLRCGAFELQVCDQDVVSPCGVTLRQIGTAEKAVEWHYPFSRHVRSIFIEVNRIDLFIAILFLA